MRLRFYQGINYKFLYRALFIALTSVCLTASAKDLKKQYFLEADNFEYNKKENLITAIGKVEVFKANYLLKADKITYNNKTHRTIAIGNVSLIKPDGEELYATSLELDDALKEIVASELKARLRDNNIFTARSAEGYQDEMTFNKASYSPCQVCKDSEQQWKIRSSKIKYKKKKVTAFTNNLFDLYGFPIFYLPYIRVASHDAEPKSGFLLPSNYNYRSIYGHGISIPYYLRINNSNDFIYAPLVTTSGQVLHSGKYRCMLQKENTNTIYAEYIRNSHKLIFGKPRGESYIKANLGHKFNDNINFKSDIESASNKAFLKNYHDRNANYLQSFAEVNYLDDSSRLNGGVRHFQELRTLESGHTDITAAPEVEYDKAFVKGNDIYTIHTYIANINKRKHGVIDKAVGKLSWFRNYMYNNHVLDFSGIADIALYKFLKADEQTNNINKNATFGRIVPEFTTMWQYPILLTSSSATSQLTPILKFIAVPANTQNNRIINEDSQEIEITDSNIFDTDRSPGSDRIEEGARLAYGITNIGSLSAHDYPAYSFILGQNYRFKKSDIYSDNSGLKGTKLSDYVGKVSLKTSSVIDLLYMFQIDKEDYKFRRNELGAIFNFDIPNSKVHRVVLDTKFSSYKYKNYSLNIDKAVNAGITVYFLKDWFVGTSLTENFSKGKGYPIESRVNLGYNGQCTKVVFSAIKDNTRDRSRSIRSGGFSYLAEIHLKNIN